MSDVQLHSKFSASAASRWLACPGSIVLSAGLPDTGNQYSRGGTAEHTVLEHCVKHGTHPGHYVFEHGGVVIVDGHEVGIVGEPSEMVASALKHIDEMVAGADIVQAETRINYSQWLGVPEADGFGTADLTAVFAEARELLVGDYKGGRGVVVDAEGNEQMMLYAGGKLLEMDDLGVEIDHVRLVIFQPRVSDAPSEWRISRADLEAWLNGRARSGATSVQLAEQTARGPDWDEAFLSPGEKQCRFCKAKATCPALRAAVAETVSGSAPATPDEFADLGVTLIGDDNAWLAACLTQAPMIEEWLKAVRAEVERRLLAGDAVPGYKLVQGKQGNRAWADETKAEEMLKTFRLKVEEMYDLKLISPTTAEKLVKAEVIGPRQWKKAEALITRSAGKPSVAPITDKRDALVVTPVADEFESSPPVVEDDIA